MADHRLIARFFALGREATWNPGWPASRATLSPCGLRGSTRGTITSSVVPGYVVLSSTNNCPSAIGNLQQWLIGTHHGESKNQLQVYLDEFVFRHNRRKTPAAAFQTLLGLGTARSSIGYEQIRRAKDLIHNPLGFAETTR